MQESIQALLDTFPEGIVQVQDGMVTAANTMAAHYLSQLEPGRPLPEEVVLPRGGTMGAGIFMSGASRYTYSCASKDGKQTILFRPAPQTALTGRQLGGTLRQMRTFLGEILAEVGPATGDAKEELSADAFGKSFHRLLRLMDNLDYLYRSSAGELAGLRLATMDLDGLCRHLVDQAYPLLREAGVTLDYESTERGLLIPGSPPLLQRLLLGLISNAAQAVGEGRVVLTLRRQQGRALATVSNNGPLPNHKQLSALFQEGLGEDVPLPGQGAGLGLSVARDIAALHRGSMLTEWGQSSPTVVLSLPTGPLDGRVSLRTPRCQVNGGLDPVLLELSDVLPVHLFGLEGLD